MHCAGVSVYFYMKVLYLQPDKIPTNRICQMLERLEKRQKFYDWPLKAE
jgi:hypothetical protein